MTAPRPARFVHLIPHYGIGGVELAAETMASVDEGDLAFRVEPIMPRAGLGLRGHAVHMARALRRIIADPPEVLILSLWKSCLVGIAAKLLRPKLRLVLFLHHTIDFHLPDWVATRLAASLSEAVWSDSTATRALRLPHRARGGVVISYRIVRLERAPPHGASARFVFWGRLHTVKRLDRALRLFALIRQGAADSHFVIAGPDDGARESLQRLVAELGLQDAVTFPGPVAPAELPALAAQASFFLMTSEAEGMAAAVVEAMQLGLVPVVTPVGEIARYARDGENAIIVSDDAEAANAVLATLADPLRHARLADAAVESWRGAETYRESVLAACRAML